MKIPVTIEKYHGRQPLDFLSAEIAEVCNVAICNYPLAGCKDEVIFIESPFVRETPQFTASEKKRCIALNGAMKVHVGELHNGIAEISAGSLEGYLRNHGTRSYGFFARTWEVTLLDAYVRPTFSPGEFCYFDAVAPMYGTEILAEYCQVIYGVEWLWTLAVAAPRGRKSKLPDARRYIRRRPAIFARC